MALIRIETTLAAPPDAVWAALHRPATLAYVSAPLLYFKPIDPPDLPTRWSEGEAQVALRGFGWLPLGRQVISVSFPEADGATRFIRDNGRGSLVQTWDHLISITPDGDGTRYTDTVRIEAGMLTPLVAAFAHVFYRHRQRRWRRLVAEGLPGTGP